MPSQGRVSVTKLKDEHLYDTPPLEAHHFSQTRSFLCQPASASAESIRHLWPTFNNEDLDRTMESMNVDPVTGLKTQDEILKKNVFSTLHLAETLTEDRENRFDRALDIDEYEISHRLETT